MIMEYCEEDLLEVLVRMSRVSRRFFYLLFDE